MVKTNYVFKRIEKKYFLHEEDLNKFLTEIDPYVEKDEYGEYTICNIYYDTEQDDLIRTSIEKPVYKEKLRMRSYGIPSGDDKVFLEIKKKYDGIVFKRRISLPFSEAENYILNGVKPSQEGQILNEIDYFIKFYKPLPKLYLAYDRIAFSGKEDKNLRITIDKNIRSRIDEIDFKYGDYGEYLLNEGEYILEIKTGTAFPMWLTDILSKNEIYPCSFSKYGNIYTKNMKNNIRSAICSQVS